MTKHQWKSLKSVRIHIDPEREEQLRWVKIGKQPQSLQLYGRIWDEALKPKRLPFKTCLPAQYFPQPAGFLWYTEWQLLRKIENQVKRTLQLTKSINSGNKERRLKKKSEVIQLTEDFQKQYESLFSLYEDLRNKVKKNVICGGNGGSSSTSDSDTEESSSSPLSAKGRHGKISSGISKIPDIDSQESETSDVEETILKDKLTSSSEPKKAINLDSELAFSQPVESEEILKDLRVEGEESENTGQRSAQIKYLEGQIASLKLEVSTLSLQKSKLEEKLKSKENEFQLYSLEKQSEDNEQRYLSRISELVAQANDTQLELNTLKHQKSELEERLLHETRQRVSQVDGLMEQFNSVNSQRAELELELRNISEDRSESLVQIEALRNELKGTAEENERLIVQVGALESEIQSLSSKNIDLEEQVKKLNHEAFQSNVEKEELQTSVTEREKELSSEREKFDACQRTMSANIKCLTEEVKNLKNKLENLQNQRNHLQLEMQVLQNEKEQLQMEFVKKKEESSLSISQMEKKNTELTNKVAHQQETLLELEAVISKLKDENEQAQTLIAHSKSNFQVLERKMEEMAEELRKQFEDQYRMLSRRIRVAEQLQAENKEWYSKTKEAYEQETKDLKERADKTEIGLTHMKHMALTANDVLASLDSVALKFEECSANFLNRISKSFCELKFAKHWTMRKNKALLHVKEDIDCLLSQLDDKEAEILVFREKLWKSENKVRELEKNIKETEDGMLRLIEEKREAIRQLCVWIDYHRGRSDYYKKLLTDMNAGCKRAT